MSHRDDHPHRAGTWDWITFLVTGPEKNLQGFMAVTPVELFDRRGNTLRCRAFACPKHPDDRGQHNYDEAVRQAKEYDVTLQDLVDTRRRKDARTHMLGKGATVTVADCVEEYPVVHLGTHGMKWERKR